jgi:two-component system, sensor histidine kinase
MKHAPRGGSILIVDDDPALLRVLPDMLHLRLPDVRVDTADSGRAAIERMAARDYDAIVTDIKMPGMDGLELLAQIHSLRPDTPTLLITGHGEHDLAVRALRGGAFDFIQKPIDRDYFAAAMSRALRMRHMRRDVERRRRMLKRRAARLEQIVTERTRELLDANRAKDEFLAVLAHELRNPLAPMRNAVEVMRLQGSADAVMSGAREIIQRQVTHMARLVDDLLDVSRITSGKIELRRAVVDMRVSLERCLDNAQAMVRSHGHELTGSLSAEPLWVDADPVRLEQIVGNLLNNAAKYTDGDGHITVEAAREGQDVVVRVRDTGIGIEPDMLRRIFELFAQAERSLARSRGGLGIGLTLVRQLIQLHGGTVEAASSGPGKGSEFTVRIPAAEPPALRGDPGTALEGADAAARVALPPRTILVVEDNADSRESLRQLLALQGHHVEVAPDGPEGLRLARTLHPDLALVDVGLPGISGYEIAERLRAAPEHEGTFLVALTGYGSAEVQDRSRAAGFDAHLLKPVDPQVLFQIVSTLRGSASSV